MQQGVVDILLQTVPHRHNMLQSYIRRGQCVRNIRYGSLQFFDTAVNLAIFIQFFLKRLQLAVLLLLLFPDLLSPVSINAACNRP